MRTQKPDFGLRRLQTAGRRLSLMPPTWPKRPRRLSAKDGGRNERPEVTGSRSPRGRAAKSTSIFGIWNALAQIPDARFGIQAPRLLASLDVTHVARRTERLRRASLQEANRRGPWAKPPAFTGALFRQSATRRGKLPIACSTEEYSSGVARPASNVRNCLGCANKVICWKWSIRAHPARAPILVDSPTPKDSPIFIRGEAENKGEIVPRRFLEVLSGPSARPRLNAAAGRLELAQAIASNGNPLTARVLRQPGMACITSVKDWSPRRTNLGINPHHRPSRVARTLLHRFMDDGWSIKKLHKLILLSATYSKAALQSDPRREGA